MRPFDWLFAAALVLVYAPAVLAMSRVWGSVDYYSHGYLVPVVALWAATSQRHVLPRLPSGRDGRGLALVGVALALYLAGMATTMVALQGVSLVLCVAGAILFLRGAAWLRALTFPVAYLLFMVPVPDGWITPVIVKLQLFVSTVGVALLQGVGVAVYREGNVLEIPGGETLFIAEACSGITSIITLLPLAVFLAYFTQRGLVHRLALVAAVVPLAMLGNLIRVLGTVLAAGRFGAEAATSGPVHDSAGILTYVLGCLALLGVGTLIRRFIPERNSFATP